MSQSKTTRREFATLALTAAAAAGALGASVDSAAAYQGNMERALRLLENALEALQASTPNKGGHRERAIELVRNAIGETQAGIDFAASHGGGGY